MQIGIIMTRIISRFYGSFMIDLQHSLFLKNGGQLSPIPYNISYTAKTGSDIIYNMFQFLVYAQCKEYALISRISS